MTATLRLYEISDALQAIGDTLVENGGELTPELTAQLDGLEGAFDAKVERIVLYIRNLETTSDAATQEAKRLAGLASTRAAAAARLRDYVKREMERTDHKKVETGLIVARIQKNGRPSVHFTGDAATLPVGYQRTVVELNRETAIENWRAGVPLPPGLTVEQGSHLRLS